MNILNMRNDQNIRKYNNIAECRQLLAQKVPLHEYVMKKG